MSIPGGNLEKLKIMGFQDAKLKKPLIKDGIFVAAINPASIALSYSTKYTESSASVQGSGTGGEVNFKGNVPPNISFDIVLDGTGALGNLVSSAPASVNVQIELFRRVCQYYVSNTHDVPYVLIQWGTTLISYKDVVFASRLETFKINYTLFSPLGIPLRATLSASFVGAMDTETGTALEGKSSPDLTHLVTVKAGDSLPMLCKDIYDDPQMYHQVAKINKLTNFRQLVPGQQLEFPPIKQL